MQSQSAVQSCAEQHFLPSSPPRMDMCTVTAHKTRRIIFEMESIKKMEPGLDGKGQHMYGSVLPHHLLIPGDGVGIHGEHMIKVSRRINEPVEVNQPLLIPEYCRYMPFSSVFQKAQQQMIVALWMIGICRNPVLPTVMPSLPGRLHKKQVWPEQTELKSAEKSMKREPSDAGRRYIINNSTVRHINEKTCRQSSFRASVPEYSTSVPDC